jgi:hypothetical protein
MVHYDELIGKNVARLRGSRSQKEIADAMRAAGWKWSQTTVWSVETGERPLRMAEAIDLADVFETSVMTLLQDRFNVQVLMSRVEKAFETASADLERLMYVQLELAASADEKGLTVDDVREHLESMDSIAAQGFAARSTLGQLEDRSPLWGELNPVQTWHVARLRAIAAQTPYDLELLFSETMPNLINLDIDIDDSDGKRPEAP